MSLSPKDLDFIESKNAAAREIALALGVPPMLLGIPGDNTYANFQEANRTFWRQTVLPLLTRTLRALSAWLSPAYGAELVLRPDTDAIDALSSERDALWTRIGAAGFLTDDEKRAAVGYGAGKAGVAGRKYNHNHDESGRFTFAPDGGTQVAEAPSGVDGPTRDFSPSKFGWHDYTEGPNEVCRAELRCSTQHIADYLSRFAVPGQDPNIPVENDQQYLVYDPRTNMPAGFVITTLRDDGLTIVNRTMPVHVFYDGMIERAAKQADDGSWSVTTRGIGNNVVPGFNNINKWQGPKIFREIDFQMRRYIEIDRATRKSATNHEVDRLVNRTHSSDRTGICNGAQHDE